MLKRELNKNYGRYSLLLIAVLFARALIPVGYMLTLPDGEQSEFALHLCPSQNRGVDLSLFADAGGTHSHHHGGTESAESNASGNNEVLAVSAECRSWVNSATFTLDLAEVASGLPHWVGIRPLLGRDVLSDQFSILSPQARAPPPFIHT